MRSPPSPTINGTSPKVINIRCGSIERWRVLNGSVDGRGFKRIMVLEGQYVYRPLDPTSPKPEEWAVYNSSTILWGNTDTTSQPQEGQ